MFEIWSNFFRNEMNYLTGRNQEFDELLEAGDISRVKSKMQTRYNEAMAISKEYDPSEHLVMHREDKIVRNKLGMPVGLEKVAKLPVPYQQYINEVALVFLLGKPLTWSNKNDESDGAFEAYNKFIKDTHFNSKLREAKRLAGAETESAMLFRVYLGNDNKPQTQIRVLAASKGDKIYTRWDIYGNLLTAGWGYQGKTGIDGDTTECFDVYTPEFFYHCVKEKIGWTVDKQSNLIGKIPMIIFRQEEEWRGVQKLIERNEMKHSRTADTNDYFEDPMLLLSADIIKNLPEKRENAKTLAIKGDVDIDKAAKFLTYDQASESKKQETEWLDETILNMSFTPKITLDTMRQVAQLSAKALRTVLLLGYMKADKRKDTWDEMMDRTASLITAIIGNVMDVSLKSQCDLMQIEHQWSEPFGDDITDTLKNIAEAYGAGIMSEETAIEQNPLIRDKQQEKERLAAQREANLAFQRDIFNDEDEEDKAGAGTGE